MKELRITEKDIPFEIVYEGGSEAVEDRIMALFDKYSMITHTVASRDLKIPQSTVESACTRLYRRGMLEMKRMQVKNPGDERARFCNVYFLKSSQSRQERKRKA